MSTWLLIVMVWHTSRAVGWRHTWRVVELTMQLRLSLGTHVRGLLKKYELDALPEDVYDRMYEAGRKAATRELRQFIGETPDPQFIAVRKLEIASEAMMRFMMHDVEMLKEI